MNSSKMKMMRIIIRQLQFIQFYMCVWSKSREENFKKKRALSAHARKALSESCRIPSILIYAVIETSSYFQTSILQCKQTRQKSLNGETLPLKLMLFPGDKLLSMLVISDHINSKQHKFASLWKIDDDASLYRELCIMHLRLLFSKFSSSPFIFCLFKVQETLQRSVNGELFVSHSSQKNIRNFEKFFNCENFHKFFYEPFERKLQTFFHFTSIHNFYSVDFSIINNFSIHLLFDFCFVAFIEYMEISAKVNTQRRKSGKTERV